MEATATKHPPRRRSLLIEPYDDYAEFYTPVTTILLAVLVSLAMMLQTIAGDMTAARRMTRTRIAETERTENESEDE